MLNAVPHSHKKDKAKSKDKKKDEELQEVKQPPKKEIMKVIAILKMQYSTGEALRKKYV